VRVRPLHAVLARSERKACGLAARGRTGPAAALAHASIAIWVCVAPRDLHRSRSAIDVVADPDPHA